MFITALKTEKGTHLSQKSRYCAIKADISKNNNTKQVKVIILGFFKTAACIHHYIFQYFLGLKTIF